MRDLHFYETPYWKDKAERMKVNPKKELDKLKDFLSHPISVCEESDIKQKSIEYFIPRRIVLSKDYLPLTSSGSLKSKTTVPWSKNDIKYNAKHLARITELYNVPSGINWLIMGPSSPAPFHPIMEKLVEIKGGVFYFAPIETRGLKKYLASIRLDELMLDPFLEARIAPCIEYASDTLAREKIEFLGTTFFLLPKLMKVKGFESVKFIYVGGMEIPPPVYKSWKEELERMGIKILTSYGHYNVGLAFDLPHAPLTYYPPAPLSFLYVVDETDPFKFVPYGERGRVRYLRVSSTMLWCQLERDYAERVGPNKEFSWDGLKEVKATF